MFIFRAVNIYPSQIDHILGEIDGVGSEYQIHLNQDADGRDYMNIRVERNNGNGAGEDNGLAEQVSARIRKKLLVRSRVEIVDYGNLPRTEKKSTRVFDNRPSE